MNLESADDRGDIPTLTQVKNEGDGPPANTQDFKGQGNPTDPGSDLDKVKDHTTEEQQVPQDKKPYKRPRTVSFSEDICEYKRSNASRNKPVLKWEDDDSGVPYDRGWAWMIDLGCFLLFFVYISHDHWHSVLLIDYLQEFNISVSLVTIMMSVGSVCYCVATQVSTNVLVTRYSIRVVTTCAAVLNVGATLIFAASPTVATFFIANLIKFTVKGITLIATLILVGFYFKRRRGLATTLGLLGVSTSFVFAPPLIRFLREEYGFKGCFLILAGLEMHGIVAALLLRPISSYMRKKAVPDISSLGKEENNPLIVKHLNDQSIVNRNLKMAEVLDQLSNSTASITEMDEPLSDRSDVNRTLLSEEEDPNLKGKGDSSKDTIGQAIIKSSTTSNQSNGDNVVDTNTHWDKNNTNIDKYHSPGQDAADRIVRDNTVRQDDVNKENPANNNIHVDKSLIEDTADKYENLLNSENGVSAISEKDKQTNISACEEVFESTGLIHTETVSQDSHQIEICAPNLHHTSHWSLVTASTMGSMLNIAHVIEAPTAATNGQLEKRHQMCSWIFELIDVPLLKNYLALMIALMYILVNAGMFSIIYLPSYAKLVGVAPQNAALLLTVVGAMDIVGRLGFGFLADLKLLRPHMLIAIACLCIGTVTQFVVLYDGFEKLIFFAVMQGLLGGAGQNLTTVLIVDVVGIQYLGKLLSMSSMFNSFSFIIQHPIQGAIIEATGNFVATFHYVGSCFLLATLLIACEPFIRKLQVAKEKKQGLKQQPEAA